MDERQQFDFWYAVNNTEVVLLPRQHLETFGTTLIHYRLVSELMDSVDRVRVREGRLQASQPQIITPSHFANTLLEGFGQEAARYVEWLRKHEKDLRILQYGFSLRQESFSEHIISDKLAAVVERVKAEAEQAPDPMNAVAIGVDAPWDVCLIKLFRDVVQGSAPANVRELQQRRLLEAPDPRRDTRREVEAAFLAASKDASRIAALAELLQRHNLMRDYEDRFFALVQAKKKHP